MLLYKRVQVNVTMDWAMDCSITFSQTTCNKATRHSILCMQIHKVFNLCYRKLWLALCFLFRWFLNVNMENGYPNWGFLCFPSAPTGKWWDSNFKHAMTTYFHILFSPTFYSMLHNLYSWELSPWSTVHLLWNTKVHYHVH